MAEQIYSESATADEMDLGDTLRQLFCGIYSLFYLKYKMNH